MKKRIHKIGIILLTLLLLQMTVLSVGAETEREIPMWEDFASKKVNYVEDTYRPLTKGLLMYHGYIKLEDNNGKAGVYGETLASRDADEVGLNIYLDQYSGTAYNNYTYWKTIEYNTSMNIKSYMVSVPRGYYYRLQGYHYVDDGSDFENGETLTDGLKIPQ